MSTDMGSVPAVPDPI